MLSTIIAIIITLATGTTPAQPTTQNPSTETKDKEKPKTSSDPSLGTFGGIGHWTEG